MKKLSWLFSGHEFEQTLGNGEGQGNLACCTSWGRKELDTTERLSHNSLHAQTCRKLLPSRQAPPPMEAQRSGDTGACVLLSQGGTYSLQY